MEVLRIKIRVIYLRIKQLLCHHNKGSVKYYCFFRRCKINQCKKCGKLF